MTGLTLLHNPEARGPAHTPSYLHKGKLYAPLKAAGSGLVYSGEGVQHTAVLAFPDELRHREMLRYR